MGAIKRTLRTQGASASDHPHSSIDLGVRQVDGPLRHCGTTFAYYIYNRFCVALELALTTIHNIRADAVKCNANNVVLMAPSGQPARVVSAIRSEKHIVCQRPFLIANGEVTCGCVLRLCIPRFNSNFQHCLAARESMVGAAE